MITSADSSIIGVPEYGVKDGVFLHSHSIINLDVLSLLPYYVLTTYVIYCMFCTNHEVCN